MSDTPHIFAPSASFDIAAGPSRRDMARAAREDLLLGLSMWRLCWSLALLDIKLRYRGSVIGPFWLTLSTGVMIGSMGFLYAALFHMELHKYFPFLALSIVLWNFIAALVAEACQCYILAEGLIRSVRMPITLYAGRVVLRNLLVLAHNVVVIVVVDAVTLNTPTLTWLLAIPAIMLWLLLSFAVVLLLGALCARFRDIPPIVGSVMQMAFFVSGVIWHPSQLVKYEYLLVLNPFYSMLEILRAPLLGEVPTLAVYASALGYAVLTVSLTTLLFVRVRGRIAFWV